MMHVFNFKMSELKTVTLWQEREETLDSQHLKREGLRPCRRMQMQTFDHSETLTHTPGSDVPIRSTHGPILVTITHAHSNESRSFRQYALINLKRNILCCLWYGFGVNNIKRFTKSYIAVTAIVWKLTSSSCEDTRVLENVFVRQ